ncbi:Multidrug resistance protein [Dirofilaria immitis]
MLKNVRFAYPVNCKCMVLKEMTMKALKGKTIALMDSSRCGKSTVIQLIKRFYDPRNGGRIKYNEDIRHLNLSNLRNQIVLTNQEPILFNYSDREKIAYGLTDVSQRH